MYGSPSYMVAYGATAPTLPSGKKYPLIYFWRHQCISQGGFWHR